jgi:hypothetical protein
MSIPSDEQITRLPQTEHIRRALTTPSGRLKDGVRVKEYVQCMDMAAFLDAHVDCSDTRSGSLAFRERILESCRSAALLASLGSL